MAQNLSEQLAIASGVTWVDIYERSGGKTLMQLTEEDWINIGGFREGTFNFTGDEMTITEQKYENGQTIVATTKDGTYGAEGSLADLHPAVCKKVLRMKDIATTGAAEGAYVKGREVIGYGDSIGLLEGVFIRLRFEQGYYDSLIYPNANISSRLEGAGSSEDLVNITTTISTSKSNDADSKGQFYLLVGREVKG